MDVCLPLPGTLNCSKPVVPLWASLSCSSVLAAAAGFCSPVDSFFTFSALGSTRGLGRVALSTAQTGADPGESPLALALVTAPRDQQSTHLCRCVPFWPQGCCDVKTSPLCGSLLDAAGFTVSSPTAWGIVYQKEPLTGWCFPM